MTQPLKYTKSLKNIFQSQGEKKKPTFFKDPINTRRKIRTIQSLYHNKLKWTQFSNPELPFVVFLTNSRWGDFFPYKSCSPSHSVDEKPSFVWAIWCSKSSSKYMWRKPLENSWNTNLNVCLNNRKASLAVNRPQCQIPSSKTSCHCHLPLKSRAA